MMHVILPSKILPKGRQTYLTISECLLLECWNFMFLFLQLRRTFYYYY